MKPDHICVNHPGVEAVGFCHHCRNWLCSRCVTEGRENYYCRKPECLKALKIEDAWAQGKCPFCGKKYNPMSPFCGSCGKQLRELTPEEKTDDLVTIARYGNPMEANLALSKLKSEGIEAYVADEQMVSIYSANMVFGGMRLQVKKTEMEKAIQILDLKPPNKK